MVLVSMFFLVIMSVVLFPQKAFAKAPLDEIRNYTVIVDMTHNGYMDIKYNFDWLVLDDTSEGPLTWVKIGLPNKYLKSIDPNNENENEKEIVPLTENIKEAKYYEEGGKPYARIEFDREYKKGECVSFGFWIRQSHMYVIDEEDHLLRYSFTPAWFDEIEVKNITVKWNANFIIKTNAPSTEKDDEKIKDKRVK